MKLTDVQLRSIKPTVKTQKLADGHGLYMVVSPAGGKLWRFDYSHDGKRKTLSLGKYPEVTLKLARERHSEARKLLSEGIDPSEHRRTAKRVEDAKKENTFELVSRRWNEKFCASITPETAKSKMQRLELHVFPFIGKMPIQDIKVSDIRDLLQRIIDKGTLSVAHAVRAELSQVFRYAVAREIVQFDIAAGLSGTLPPVKTKHFSSITDTKRVAGLLRVIDSFEENAILRQALKILCYCFVRSNELRKASWSEINFDEGNWRIPAVRMKMREMHIVPLSRQALEAFTELHALTGQGRHIFPAFHISKHDDRCMSSITLLSSIRRLGFSKEEMTIHGFRSMASTILNEQGYRSDLIERQLAHTEKNSVRASYNHAEYLPERRKMMQEYANYLDELRDTVK
jgi:integrase